MATIYCMRCGAPLSDSARFCTECGSPTLLGLKLAEERREQAAERIAAEDEALKVEAAPQAQVDPDPDATVRTTPEEVAAAQEAAAAAPEPRHAGAPAATAGLGDAAQASGKGLHHRSSGSGVHVPNAFKRILEADDESARRTKVWGLVAAVFAFVVVLVAGFASGLLGSHKADTTELPAASTEESAEAPEETLNVEVRATLADYSWDELSSIAKAMTRANTREEALDLASTYHLMDYDGKLSDSTKDVTIIGVGTMHMRLVGIWHDDLADGGKAGLTFLSDNLLFTRRMKDVDDNVGGWEGTELRHWLNVDVFNSLPGDLRTNIVAVDKHTNNTGQTLEVASVTSTLDKLWIPSLVELTGPIAWRWDSDPANSELYNAVMNAEGTQYEYFASTGISQDYGNESLVKNGENGALQYWLRSSSCSKPQHYRTVNTIGNPINWAAATDELGVCVGFSL